MGTFVIQSLLYQRVYAYKEIEIARDLLYRVFATGHCTEFLFVIGLVLSV